MTHYFRVGKYIPSWKGRLCKPIAWGKLHTVLIEFENGERTVTSRWSIRVLPKKP